MVSGLPRKGEENELNAMYGTVGMGEGWRMGLMLGEGIVFIGAGWVVWGEVTLMREGGDGVVGVPWGWDCRGNGWEDGLRWDWWVRCRSGLLCMCILYRYS